MSENRIGESSSESSISSSSGGGGLYNLHGNALTLTLLGIVVFILVLLSFHYKHRLRRGRGRARSQFMVTENSGAAGTEVPPSPPSKGLHDSTLQALPVFPFDPEWAQREGGLGGGGRGGSWAEYLQQCAVCLSSFEGGDEVRLLPRCMHAFHAACIDLWFRSHSDCPLCRQRVHDDGEGGNNDSGSGTGGNTAAAAEVVVCIGGSGGSASASTTANNNVTSTTAPHTWLKVATCEEDHGT